MKGETYEKKATLHKKGGGELTRHSPPCFSTFMSAQAKKQIHVLAF